MCNQLLYFTECHKGKIPFNFIELSDLEETYADKATVKVSCATGYVGLLKLLCDNGSWKQTGGRDCKSKHTKSKYI